MKRPFPWILPAGDVLALLLFVVIGQADHQTLDLANPFSGLLANLVSFIVPWIGAGWLLRAYVPPRDAQGRVPFLGRSLTTWLVAAPLGVLLRALLLGRATIPVLFLLVTLAAGGALVLGWRLLFVALTRGKSR